MHEKFKAGLVLTAFLALVTGLQLAVGYAFYSALESDDRQDFAAMLIGQRELLLELGLLELGLFGIAFIVAYQVYVPGSLKIAEGVRIILNANPGHRLELAGPVELRQAVQAINALADHSETLTHNLEARIAEAKSSVEAEKNRLAALMSELSQGVPASPLRLGWRSALWLRHAADRAGALDFCLCRSQPARSCAGEHSGAAGEK